MQKVFEIIFYCFSFLSLYVQIYFLVIFLEKYKTCKAVVNLKYTNSLLWEYFSAKWFMMSDFEFQLENSLDKITYCSSPSLSNAIPPYNIWHPSGKFDGMNTDTGLLGLKEVMQWTSEGYKWSNKVDSWKERTGRIAYWSVGDDGVLLQKSNGCCLFQTECIRCDHYCN